MQPFQQKELSLERGRDVEACLQGLRDEDDEERDHIGRHAEVALQSVRILVGEAHRLLRQVAACVSAMAFGQGLPGRARDGGPHLQEEDLCVLVALAHPPNLRRDPPRRLHGRPLAHEEVRRPHRMHRRARHRLPSGQIGELKGLGMPHAENRAA